MKKINLIPLVLLFSLSVQAKTIKVAIIDTGIAETFHGKLCGPAEDFTGYGVKDVNGHGTIIANLIAHELVDVDYCFYILKFYHSRYDKSDASNNAFERAIELKVDAINFSAAGKESDDKERELILKAMSKGIKIFVPSSNENVNLDKECNVYPTCYFNNFYVVGRNDNKGNIGSIVRIKEEGKKGTSMATATACGKKMRNK